MRKLRLVRLSALFPRQRLRDGHPPAAEEHGYAEEAESSDEKETWRAEDEHRPAFLEVRADERPAALEIPAATEPASGGEGVDTPTTSHASWGFLGLLLLAGLVAKACSDRLKGGVEIMNIPFLLAAIIAIGGVSLHVYTMEVWIWPS